MSKSSNSNFIVPQKGLAVSSKRSHSPENSNGSSNKRLSQDFASFKQISELISISESEFLNLVNQFVKVTTREHLSQSLLQIAVICQSHHFIGSPFYQQSLTKVLKNFQVYKKPGVIMFFQALVIATLSKQELNMENLKILKEFIIEYFQEGIHYEDEDELFSTSHDIIIIQNSSENVRLLAKYMFEKDPQLHLLCTKGRNNFLLFCSASSNVLLKLKESSLGTDFCFALLESIIKKIEFYGAVFQVKCFDFHDWSSSQLNMVVIEELSSMEMCFNVLKDALVDKRLQKRAIEFSNFGLLRKMTWLLLFCSKHFFVTEEQSILLEMKPVLISILNVLTTLCTVKYKELHEFSMVFLEHLLLLVIRLHYSTYDEKFHLEMLALEVCLLLFHNEWISEESYCVIMLKKFEIHLAIVDSLIKVLKDSLGKIKQLESIKICTSDSGPAMNFLKHEFCYEDVQEYGLAHMEHNFKVSYITIMLALFCDGNVNRRQRMQNNISSVEAKACIDILMKFQEFTVYLVGPHLLGTSLLERSLAVFRLFQD